MKPILKLFSYIFHPLFVSVYTSLYFFYFYKNIFNIETSFYFLSQIALLTIVLPLILFYAFISLKLISSDVMLNNVKQRRIPLAVQIIYFYIICYQTLRPLIHYEIRYFFIGALLSTIIAFIASIFNKKISLHMIGVSGMVSFIIGLNIKSESPSLLLICSLILIVGIVASSRLYMKAHSISELFWGTIIGALTQIILFIIWL